MESYILWALNGCVRIATFETDPMKIVWLMIGRTGKLVGISLWTAHAINITNKFIKITAHTHTHTAQLSATAT